jgi:uncharacterized membrane protein YhaH (DUF805 family)
MATIEEKKSMTFGQAIQTCLRKYADFAGRAARSEFWWFILFTALVSAALTALNLLTPNGAIALGTALAQVWSIAILVPTLAVAVRRLRDSGRSWMELLWLLVPIAGVIILVIRLVESTQEGEPTHAPAGPTAA